MRILFFLSDTENFYCKTQNLKKPKLEGKSTPKTWKPSHNFTHQIYSTYIIELDNGALSSETKNRSDKYRQCKYQQDKYTLNVRHGCAWSTLWMVWALKLFHLVFELRFKKIKTCHFIFETQLHSICHWRRIGRRTSTKRSCGAVDARHYRGI